MLETHQLTAWRNAVFLIFAMPGIALATWVARLPAIRDALDIRIDQVGLLVFGMAAGSIIGLLASSHVIARFGTRRTIAFLLPTTALGLAIVGLAVTLGPSFGLAFAGLVLFGAGSGATDVAMNVSGAANERALKRSIMPIFHAFFSFGTMIGAGAGALAEAAQVPIAVHLGVVAAIIVICTFIALPRLQSEHVIEEGAPAQSASEAGGSWRSRLSIWADPRTLLIGVLVLGAAFAEGSANDWLALAMVDGQGVSNTVGALVFGLFVTAMTAGRLGGVILLDKFGRVPVLRGSFLLAAVGLLLLIMVPNPRVAAFGAVLWGLGAALGFPIGMSAAADDPQTAAARVSAVATIGYFAFLVGPPVIGFLGEQVGLLSALLVVLVLCAIGALVSGAAREPEKRAPAAEPAAADHS